MTRYCLFVTGLSLGLLMAAGCESRMLWDYRDEPYVHAYAERGEAFCLRKLQSVYTDDREVAVRALAEMAARDEAAGGGEHASRLKRVVFSRYAEDKNKGVQGSVVAVCAPALGPDDPDAVNFLRQRIAEGEWSAQAAYSLAAMAPAGTLQLLAPLTNHPDRQRRYEAALALTILGDARGAPLVANVLRQMEAADWPRTTGGVSTATARRNLEARARRVWPVAAQSVGLDSAPLPVTGEKFEAIPSPEGLRPRADAPSAPPSPSPSDGGLPAFLGEFVPPAD